jgi:hypothetical protein
MLHRNINKVIIELLEGSNKGNVFKSCPVNLLIKGENYVYSRCTNRYRTNR